MTELPDVVAEPALREQGAIQTIPHPAGDYETVGPPFAIHGADMGVRGRSPQPGEHTFEALREAGLNDDQIASLAAEGIFG
jgi:crotonobetainyl-CoA:carnitine CoA-transferase CaiB-like acyl-CoA transferase